jgi:ABC-type lipoprotein release transport system permease subunit
VCGKSNYSNLATEHGLTIVVGVYVMFLLAGLMPAVKAARLKPVQAMRQR